MTDVHNQEQDTLRNQLFSVEEKNLTLERRLVVSEKEKEKGLIIKRWSNLY